MKRGQQFGRWIRGKVRVRKNAKKAVNQAERTEAKRQLKKDPEELETKTRRRYWGYDD